MFFTIIALLVGAFVGYVLHGSFPALRNVGQAVRGGLDNGRQVISSMTASMAQGQMISLGIIILIAILVLWIAGFFLTLIIGFLLGLAYHEKFGQIPFVSGLADSVKQLISSNTNKPG